MLAAWSREGARMGGREGEEAANPAIGQRQHLVASTGASSSSISSSSDNNSSGSSSSSSDSSNDKMQQ
ncbi:hypothetical protein VYU27_003943 [Nannochloropsis oceanica]